MTDLPDGWTSCLLGSVAEIKLGKMLDKAKNEGPLRSYLRNINVRWFGFDLSDLAQMRMSDVEAKLFDVRDGDVLVCEGGEPGRSAVWNLGDLPLTYQKALHRVRLQPALLPKMLVWQLRLDSLSFKLDSHFTGSTIKHFPLIALQRYPVSIPPLAEQQRIADKLDTVLTRVDAVSTRLARVAPILKSFRQSVLAAATSGRLTEDWRDINRPTSAQAKGQLDTITQSRFQRMKKAKEAVERTNSEEFEIPNSWLWTSLDALTAKIVDGTHHTPTYVGEGVPFVSVKDIRDGVIDFSSTKFIAEVEHRELSKRCLVERGDLLITKSGTIGRTALVKTDIPFSLFVSVALLKPASSAVNMRFIDLVLRHWVGSIDISSRIVGSTIKNLHLVDMKVLGIPFPCLDEQAEIVRRVETLFAFADRLEARLKAAQAAAGRLTPALLAKAFRGELVPQDPDDEPASELLRRLQAASDHLAPARAAGRGRKRSI